MRRLDLRSRQGVSEALSTILSVPLLLVIAGMMIYFGRALYAKAAIEDAASVGARFAATSLSGAQAAVLQVLEGHYLDPGGAHISIRPVTRWGRGTQAQVNVTYVVGQSGVPIFGTMLGPTTVSTRYTVVIDTYNNRYANGYVPCG